MTRDDQSEYAELHALAARNLARLRGLDLGCLPVGLRQRLLAHRANLEALVASTTPAAASHLHAALERSGGSLSIDELWALVRSQP